jgi:hypothetical protein
MGSIAMDWSDSAFQLYKVSDRLPIDHFHRFRTSNHSRDLYYLCLIAILLVAIFISISIIYKVKMELFVAIITALFGVLSWTYQAANTRFGAADLFAGEIAALCRIAAVADIMSSLAKQYCIGVMPAPPASQTTEYFIAYNNNAKDMEALDGDVVESVAQFYVNMKVFRDVLRQPTNARDAAEIKERQLTAIYYGFLAFESARIGLAVLIDDRQRSREAILAAMRSELPAYVLLYSELRRRPHDLRWSFISARLPKYRILLKEIRDNLPAGRGRELAEQVLQYSEQCEFDGNVRIPDDWLPPGASVWLAPPLAAVEHR